jgi:tRNA G46 methylase TrmB
MSIYKSKIITSLQDGIHENLEKSLKRYNLSNYVRPKRSFSDDNLSKIKNWLKGDSFIFDIGCGIGESSYNLSKLYPDTKILGIDKSISRLDRNNSFKVSNANILLIQDDMFDLIPLLYAELKEKVLSVHIYYPNPWPKKSQLKRRIHANPIAPFLFELSNNFYLRSNWKIYLDEFSKSFEFYKGVKSQVVEVEEFSGYLTPFEKKYHLSDQAIYELIIR